MERGRFRWMAKKEETADSAEKRRLKKQNSIRVHLRPSAVDPSFVRHEGACTCRPAPAFMLYRNRIPTTAAAQKAGKGACGELNRRSAAKSGVRRWRLSPQCQRESWPKVRYLVRRSRPAPATPAPPPPAPAGLRSAALPP